MSQTKVQIPEFLPKLTAQLQTAHGTSCSATTVSLVNVLHSDCLQINQICELMFSTRSAESIICFTFMYFRLRKDYC